MNSIHWSCRNRERTRARSSKGPGIRPSLERCESRILMASSIVAKPPTYQPLQLSAQLDIQGTSIDLDGPLQLQQGSTKSAVVGTFQDAVLGVIPVTGDLSGDQLRLDLAVPGAGSIEAIGVAISGKTKAGQLTIESQDEVLDSAGDVVGFLNIQGATLTKSLPMPKAAKPQIVPGTKIQPSAFKLEVTEGADAGTKLDGLLELGTVGKNGKVAGKLVGTEAGDVSVTGQVIGGEIVLKFKLDDGKYFVGIGPFDQVSAGRLVAVGTLTGSGKGDAGTWAAGANYAGMNFAGQTLSGDYTGADLDGADLAGATITANLTNASLRGADLAGAVAIYVPTPTLPALSTLPGASKVVTSTPSAPVALPSASTPSAPTRAPVALPGPTFNGANLDGANLVDVTFSGLSLAGATFHGANLTASTLNGDDLTGADFSGGIAPLILIENSTVSSTNFSDANLRGATFSGETLANVSFVGADLTGASVATTIRSSDFDDAELKGANFGTATISDSTFTDADLTDVDLSKVVPTNVSLATPSDVGLRVPPGMVVTKGGQLSPVAGVLLTLAASDSGLTLTVDASESQAPIVSGTILSAVNWGDGTSTTVPNKVGDTATHHVHQYAQAGTHDVMITGSADPTGDTGVDSLSIEAGFQATVTGTGSGTWTDGPNGGTYTGTL